MKPSDEDDLHNLDWLKEFPAVKRSKDPEIRKAIEAMNRRKRMIQRLKATAKRFKG